MFLKGNWASDVFVTNYLPLILFPILYIISLFWNFFRTRTWRRPLRPHEMDFVSNIKEVEDDSYDEPPPKNWVERFWMWLVSACLIFWMTLGERANGGLTDVSVLEVWRSFLVVRV